jgi:hypothetical protein
VVVAFVGDKCGLLLRVFGHKDLVESPNEVELREVFRFVLHLLEDFVDSGEGMGILDSDIIEFAIVDTHSVFTIGFSGEDDGKRPRAVGPGDDSSLEESLAFFLDPLLLSRWVNIGVFLDQEVVTSIDMMVEFDLAVLHVGVVNC